MSSLGPRLGVSWLLLIILNLTWRAPHGPKYSLAGASNPNPIRDSRVPQSSLERQWIENWVLKGMWGLVCAPNLLESYRIRSEPNLRVHGQRLPPNRRVRKEHFPWWLRWLRTYFSGASDKCALQYGLLLLLALLLLPLGLLLFFVIVLYYLLPRELHMGRGRLARLSKSFL